MDNLTEIKTNTEIKINFNYFKFSSRQTKSAKILLLYAYKEGQFVSSAGHPAIQMTQTNVTCNNNIVDYIIETLPLDNSIESSALKYAQKLSKNVYNKLEESYPNNFYDENIASIKICQAFSMLGEMQNFTENFAAHVKDFQIEPLKIFSIMFKYKNIINYAYPDNQFKEDRCHATLQRIRQKSFTIGYFLDALIESNITAPNDFTGTNKISNSCLTFLTTLKSHVDELGETVLIAYPNNHLNSSLGHSAITACTKKIKLIEDYTLDNIDLFKVKNANKKYEEKVEDNISNEANEVKKVSFKF